MAKALQVLPALVPFQPFEMIRLTSQPIYKLSISDSLFVNKKIIPPWHGVWGSCAGSEHCSVQGRVWMLAVLSQAGFDAPAYPQPVPARLQKMGDVGRRCLSTAIMGGGVSLRFHTSTGAAHCCPQLPCIPVPVHPSAESAPPMIGRIKLCMPLP